VPDTKKTREISLYSLQLIELMRAVHEKGNLFRFKAKGISMTPFIRDGDILTISPLKQKLQIGDVVPFIKPGFIKLIVHRIVRKRRNNYLLKGDNSWNFDGTIHAENLLGIVSKIERGKRKIGIGFGIDKFFIAFLSRFKVLNVLLFLIRFFLSVFRKNNNNG